MTAVVQPSGTVTLVFTDIEGSIRLLEELGTEGYRAALAEHPQPDALDRALFEGARLAVDQAVGLALRRVTEGD